MRRAPEAPHGRRPSRRNNERVKDISMAGLRVGRCRDTPCIYKNLGAIGFQERCRSRFKRRTRANNVSKLDQDPHENRYGLEAVFQGSASIPTTKFLQNSRFHNLYQWNRYRHVVSRVRSSYRSPVTQLSFKTFGRFLLVHCKVHDQ